MALMPTSEQTPPTKRALTQAGFSLLEVMIVVVIIGIMISLATLSIGTVKDDGIAEQGRRLETLLSLALEEAGIQGREYGLTFYQHGYEFSQRELEQDKDGKPIWVWTPVDDDPLLKPRDLGADITLDVELGAEEITLIYERDTEKEYEPQILLMSSGDIEPEFAVRIRPTFSGDGILMSINSMGEVEADEEEF